MASIQCGQCQKAYWVHVRGSIQVGTIDLYRDEIRDAVTREHPNHRVRIEI